MDRDSVGLKSVAHGHFSEVGQDYHTMHKGLEPRGTRWIWAGSLRYPQVTSPSIRSAEQLVVCIWHQMTLRSS
jgi:hypothetical protein